MRIRGFWSSYVRGLLRHLLSYSHCRVFPVNIINSLVPPSNARQTWSLPLFQLLHLQIMVNVSHTSHLSWAWAKFGPATNIRSAVNTVEYAEPCFCSRLGGRLRRWPLGCFTGLAYCGIGCAGIDEELAMEIMPTSSLGWRSSVRSGPNRRQGQWDTSCCQDICADIRNVLRLDKLNEWEDCSRMSAAWKNWR